MAEEIIWLAVTGDDLELPIAVSESLRKLAKQLGVANSTVLKMEQRQNISRHTYMGEHYRIVKVEDKDVFENR